MPLKLDLIGIIVREMPAALAFCRRLGLDIPPELDAEGHAQIEDPDGSVVDLFATLG